jgi:transcriptional regulator with XRE-family HTH domain
MNASERFDAFLERAQGTDAYWTEKAILEYTEELIAQMELKNMSRSELAEQLGGKKPAFVTKLLRGNNNFTFDTACRLARALDMEFVPHMKPQGWQTRWMDFSPKKESAPAISFGAKKQEYQSPIEPVAGEDNEAVALAS